MILQLPIGSEEKFAGVIDLVEMLLEVAQGDVREHAFVLPAAVRALPRDQPAVAPKRLVAGRLDHVAVAIGAQLQTGRPAAYSGSWALRRVEHDHYNDRTRVNLRRKGNYFERSRFPQT